MHSGNFFRQPKFLPTLVVGLFFLGYLWLGLFIYKDFGLSWDEPYQRALGYDNYYYIKGQSTDLLKAENRYHGPLFQVALVYLEGKFGFSSTQEAYMRRHLATFLLFFVSVIAFFLLAQKRLKDWRLALLGSSFLVFSPVIFGNSFYNPKDIPFMAVFTISMLTLTFYLERPNLLTAGLHAFASAALVAIRAPGVIIPALTVLAAGLLIFLGVPRPPNRRLLWTGGFYGVLTVLLVYAFFPVLWANPLLFFDFLIKFSRFNEWRGQMLYLGQLVDDKSIPWHYLPVMLAVTTPLLYTFNFLAGFVEGVRRLAVKPCAAFDREKLGWIIDLSWFFLPLLVIILGRSVVYDSWRHVFFIYPAFLLVGLRGLSAWAGWLKQRIQPRLALAVVVLALGLTFGEAGIFMAANHPYESIYFNILAGKDMQEVKQRFELDYWGISYRAALEYIASIEPAGEVTVYSPDRVANSTLDIIDKKDQDRLVVWDNEERSRYFATIYKLHPQDYPYENEVFSIKVGNARILSVFRLR